MDANKWGMDINSMSMGKQNQVEIDKTFGLYAVLDNALPQFGLPSSIYWDNFVPMVMAVNGTNDNTVDCDTYDYCYYTGPCDEITG